MKLTSLIFCLAVCCVMAEEKEKKKEALSISITVLLDSPDSMIEVDSQKFKGDETDKIEKALGATGHYISDLVIEDAKLVKIIFKKQKP